MARCCSGSNRTTRRPRIMSTRAPAVFRWMLSGAPPFQRPFESGGRLYGGCGSSPTRPIEPSASRSRIPYAAASAAIPPPTIRYRKWITASPPSSAWPGGSRPPELVLELHRLAAHVVGQRRRDDALDLPGGDSFSGCRLEVDDAPGERVRLGLRPPLLSQVAEGGTAVECLL